MRSFVCITLPQELRLLMEQTASRLKRSTMVRASWVPVDNYHITVQFLGEIDPMLTVELQRRLGERVRLHAPFDLTLDRISAFPSVARPRVLWGGGSAAGAFAELVRSISDAISPLGFPRERKPDVFHVTLARLRGAADPRLVEAIREIDARVEPVSIRVTNITLMESRLTSRGARYSRLFDVPLRG